MNTTETGRFFPAAVYFADSDCVEYVKEDSFCVYDRVDEFLTLIWDATQQDLVGFKLKGFKLLFNTRLKPIYKLNDEQFVAVVSVIETVCTKLGDALFQDERVARAYKMAKNLAANENVRIEQVALKAAA